MLETAPARGASKLMVLPGRVPRVVRQRFVRHVATSVHRNRRIAAPIPDANPFGEGSAIATMDKYHGGQSVALRRTIISERLAAPVHGFEIERADAGFIGLRLVNPGGGRDRVEIPTGSRIPLCRVQVGSANTVPIAALKNSRRFHALVSIRSLLVIRITPTRSRIDRLPVCYEFGAAVSVENRFGRDVETTRGVPLRLIP
jgi:hypothetical protein